MMRWFLAGCCVLGVIYLSAAVPQLTQRPRFFGAKTGSTVWICCSTKPPLSGTVRWYKGAAKEAVLQGERVEFRHSNGSNFLFIHKVTEEDNGVYNCEMDDNNIAGPGTQVMVAKITDVVQAKHRTMMKDGLIIFQGLLLALCISATLLRRKTLAEKKDSIYEEPETDHIYEGLAIESCGGGLYEELSVYAQADEAEAPWE